MANNRTSFSIHNILNRGLDCEKNTGLDEEYSEEQVHGEERETRDCSSSSLPVENAGAESAQRRISSCVLVLDSSSSDQHSCEEESTGGEDNSLQRRHGKTLRQLHVLLYVIEETGQRCKHFVSTPVNSSVFSI